MHGILFNVVQFNYQVRSLGVYRIAHVLREHNADIEVVDWANHWTLEQLKQLFVSRYNANTKFIGFSHMFSIWDPVLEDFCAWIKKEFSDIKIVSGSSSRPWFKSDYIDYYVMGFGENAVVELLRYITSNGTRPKFSMEFPNGKPLIDANLNYTAFPMSSLMVKYQDRDFLQEHEWLGIETARGCKFKCAFCNFPVLGVKGDYSRDADDFRLQLLDTYDRYGIKHYTVADETFNDRTEKITKFADVVEQLPFSPWFTGFIRADLLHSRKLDMSELARMNFVGHYYGVESFNTKSARAIGKGLDSDKIKHVLLETKNYYKINKKPYLGTIGLIIGLPHESIESIRNSMNWLVSNWNDQSFLAYSLSIPTTENTTPSLISKDYEKYGYRVLSDNEIAQATDINYSGTPRVIPDDTALLWKNDHMNIFQAEDLANEFVKAKDKYNIKPSSFQVAQRSSLKTIDQRFSQSFHNFQAYLSKDISDYINSKLSI